MGRFTPSAELLRPFNGFPVAGDFNKDGFLDIAGYLADRFTPCWVTGKDISRERSQKNLFIDEVDSLVSADFDMDGSTDVAFITEIDRDYPGNLVIVQSNGPTMSWSEPSFYIVGGVYYHSFPIWPPNLITDDFNSDGRPDLAFFRDIARVVIYNTTPQRVAANFDFDGDGKTDIGIFRPAGAASEWWINRSGNGQTFALQFGASTDRIAPADYTGDGKADIAFFRPSSGEWYVLRSEDFSFFALPFGTNGDVPVPADYDADGKADFAVFRPSIIDMVHLTISRSTDSHRAVRCDGRSAGRCRLRW